MKKFPILYKRTNTGAVQIWMQEVDGNKFRTISGQLNGKLTTSAWTECIGKNIGKKNETSPEQQAFDESFAKYTKQLKSGYHEKIEDIDTERFEVMLAEKYQDFKELVDTAFANGDVVTSQPKLDGMCFWADKTGIWSRENEPIVSSPHIFEAMKEEFVKNPDLKLHGELYNNLMKHEFEDFMSIVRKTKPTAEDLALSEKMVRAYVYDLPSSKKLYTDRYNEYREVVQRLGDYFIAVQADIVKSQDELDKLYNEYLDEGYEGQMVKLNEFYQNKRTKFILKRKEFDDAEFEIVEILEGKGNGKGFAKRALMKIGNETFKAGINGDRAKCKDILDNKEKYVGKMSTVTFQGYSKYGIPRFPKIKDLVRIG